MDWRALFGLAAPAALPPAPLPDAERVARALETGRQAGRALAGGRLSLDLPNQFGPLVAYVQPPSDPESNWYLGNLDARTLHRLSPTRLMELLADLSPDVSKALWDFLRFCNPGHEVVAYRPGTDTVDPRATASVLAFEDRLEALYGAVDIPLGRIFMGAFMRGAFVAELVLDPAGKLAIDLATPDPATMRFRRAFDAARGPIWALGQYQGATFTVLDRPTIRYLPLDPLPGSPYGRPMVAPALFSTLFLLSLLHDLKRVVQQQGYPRIDVSIDLEALQAQMPPAAKSDPRVWMEWVQAVTAQVQTVFRQLQPDDQFVHANTIAVNRPVGTVDASSLGAVDGIIAALERWSSRGLKTMPFLMGLSESNTETQANRQAEAFFAGVSVLQHYAENLLGYLYGIGLQAEGLQADVRYRFAQLRESERLMTANALAAEIRNARELYSAGWESQDAWLPAPYRGLRQCPCCRASLDPRQQPGPRPPEQRPL
jgi:hypothetical protein